MMRTATWIRNFNGMPPQAEVMKCVVSEADGKNALQPVILTSTSGIALTASLLRLRG